MDTVYSLDFPKKGFPFFPLQAQELRNDNQDIVQGSFIDPHTNEEFEAQAVKDARCHEDKRQTEPIRNSTRVKFGEWTKPESERFQGNNSSHAIPAKQSQKTEKQEVTPNKDTDMHANDRDHSRSQRRAKVPTEATAHFHSMQFLKGILNCSGNLG